MSQAPKTQRYPVLPLPGAVLFPGGRLTVGGFDGLAPEQLLSAHAGSLQLLALPSLLADGADQAARLTTHGTLAVVERVVRLPNGETGALIRGLTRVRLLCLTRARGRLSAVAEPMADAPVGRRAAPLALERAVRLAAGRVTGLRAAPGAPAVALPEAAEAMTFIVLGELPLSPAERFAYLVGTDLVARMRLLLGALAREEELLRHAARLRDEAMLGIQAGQRRQLLQEQLRLLQKELGEDEPTGGGGDEVQQLRIDLSGLALPPEVRDAADRELARMALMPTGSPDYMVSLSYLGWLKELPWSCGGSALPPPLATVRRALNRQHYGLSQVKERILEYAAVMRLRGASRGEILLLCGPPGVGKSTLARRIAAALGRPFVQVALGGVRDEAEIRGHRRTYVAAMPGKLLNAMRQAKTRSPVILLDELDKVGLDHGRMAVANALLEALDYGQNHAFTDHYLGVPYDLSGVMFIATANSTAEIPRALLDRMEVLELPSYTEAEKLAIAQRHLLPELRHELGLSELQLPLADEVVRVVIRAYTREAGVRQLRRELAAIGRKAVCALAERRAWPVVTAVGLGRVLGPARFLDEPNDARLGPGVAIGLAYTETGGDIVYIESTLTPSGAGRGGLTLTGSLGKVMKESAQAALAYLARLAYLQPDLLPLAASGLSDSRVHLHLPSGALPKDGPSAGLAIVCAVFGLLTDRSMPARLALTGEITLRGQVLAVAGLKEKLLAAHRYGKTRVIIPAANRSDLALLPRLMRRELDVVMVQTVEEALVAAGLSQAAVPAQVPAAPRRPGADHLRIARLGGAP